MASKGALMGKEGRITAHQIAAMLGVSQPTVSRALRGVDEIGLLRSEAGPRGFRRRVLT